MTASTDVHHLTPRDKTAALMVLAEALQTATLVGRPAPIVQRLREWMSAPPKVGDLVLETSTKYRGHAPERIGTVNALTKGADHYDTITEILMVDPPCASGDACADVACVHRQRWSNADFLRIPITRAQLDEALAMPNATAGGICRERIAEPKATGDAVKCQCDKHDQPCQASALKNVTRDGRRIAVCDRCDMTGDGEVTYVEDSPAIAHNPMDEMLDNLVVELRAMATSQRTPMPERIAAKLHSLALVVQDTRRLARAAIVREQCGQPEKPEINPEDAPRPAVNLDDDIVAAGPDLTATEMLNDAARALGWRTDWACGDSSITWDAVLGEIRKRTATQDEHAEERVRRTSLAVDLMRALGIPADCGPTPTFGELLGKVADARRQADACLDENGAVAVASKAAHKEYRAKADAEPQKMSDLATKYCDERDMAIREHEQLKVQLGEANGALANVRKVDAEYVEYSGVALDLEVTRDLLGESMTRRREAEALVLADEEFIVTLRREVRDLQRETGRLIVKLADAERRAQGTPENTRNLRQATVITWMRNAFGEEGATVPQRGIRLLEEAMEAYQAAGCDQMMAHELVDFVFERPIGDLTKELGGVGVCVLGLAAAAKVSADAEEAREVERVLAKGLDEWRQRNAAKNEAGFAHAPPSTTTYDPDLSDVGASCKNCGRTAWSHSSREPRICAPKEVS